MRKIIGILIFLLAQGLSFEAQAQDQAQAAMTVTAEVVKSPSVSILMNSADHSRDELNNFAAIELKNIDRNTALVDISSSMILRDKENGFFVVDLEQDENQEGTIIINGKSIASDVQQNTEELEGGFVARVEHF